MTNKILEAFEGTRKAGSIASGALDEVAKIIKPGIKTKKLINYVLNLLMTTKLILRHYFIEVFQNLVVLQQTILFVMEYLKIKF